MFRASLEQLGIERDYVLESNSLHYSISPPLDKLKSPKQKEKILKKVVDAVSRDAEKGGGLDSITVSVNEKCCRDLLATAQKLLAKSMEHKERRADFLPNKFIAGVTVIGGVTGFVLGYNQTSEWATSLAEHMNNASYLWAPITGLAQASISILGTCIATVGGFVGGAIGGFLLASPYILTTTPLANRVGRYERLEQELSRLETEKQADSAR